MCPFQGRHLTPAQYSWGTQQLLRVTCVLCLVWWTGRWVITWSLPWGFLLALLFPTALRTLYLGPSFALNYEPQCSCMSWIRLLWCRHKYDGWQEPMSFYQDENKSCLLLDERNFNIFQSNQIIETSEKPLFKVHSNTAEEMWNQMYGRRPWEALSNLAPDMNNHHVMTMRRLSFSLLLAQQDGFEQEAAPAGHGPSK